MSEGVDITTLQRWIQRSTGVSDEGVQRCCACSATYGPPVCTTLQSFVNLKRNTLKLSTKPPSVAKPSDASMPTCCVSRSSYSVLPTLSYGSAAATPAARDPLPEPTHSLYFEYDCAAPYASVQIFIRASRKHGSWINWTPPAGPNGTAASDPLSSQFDKDGNPAWLSQSGPPPHVLGWPVHVAKIKKGFGSGHTAHIPLHLQYYAPPKAKKADRNAGAPGGDASDKDASD